MKRVLVFIGLKLAEVAVLIGGFFLTMGIGYLFYWSPIFEVIGRAPSMSFWEALTGYCMGGFGIILSLVMIIGGIHLFIEANWRKAGKICDKWEDK